MKRKDKPPPEIAQLQFDKGVQQLGRQQPEINVPDRHIYDDWPGKEFGLPRPVEFTGLPRRPGR